MISALLGLQRELGLGLSFGQGDTLRLLNRFLLNLDDLLWIQFFQSLLLHGLEIPRDSFRCRFQLLNLLALLLDDGFGLRRCRLLPIANSLLGLFEA